MTGLIQGDSSATDDGLAIREVGLLSGERVSHIFSPDAGLATETPAEGDALVLTNDRLIAFLQGDGAKQTYIVPAEEIKNVAVKAGRRSTSTLVQGGLMVLAGLFIYVVVAYWLTGRSDGPTIPVLHMDLAAFIALVIIIGGAGLIAQVYFTKPDGTVTFQGDGFGFSFPFRGENAEGQVYDVVNAAFAARQSKNGHGPAPGPTWED